MLRTLVVLAFLIPVLFPVLVQSQQEHPTELPYLQPAVIFVPDTSKYESYRVKVVNPTDSQVVIESATPSCGCILATIQRSRCTAEDPGDIYVAVTVARMDDLQPMTIDVVTNRTRKTPLRLTLWKKHVEGDSLQGNN
jgi:hypothetical protein